MGYSRRIIKLLPVLFFIIIAEQSRAQDVSDLELWSGLAVRYDLTKKLRVQLEEQFRFYENIGARKESLTELELKYELFEFLDVSGKYRYTDNADGRDERRFSMDLDTEYDIPKIPIDVTYRIRFQDDKVSYTDQKSVFLRNRLGLDYNMTKLVDPYAEYEVFYLFSEKYEVRTNRYTFGLVWKLTGDLDLDTFYRIDKERNVEVPKTQHIIGLMVSYDIN